jgi:hypothetical protein
VEFSYFGDDLRAMFGKMRKLTDKRYNEGTVKRRVLGVFVALWLSLGLQPCAVAAAGDVDCPHCPTEQEQSMAAMVEHCDPQNGSSYSSAPSDCYEVEESAVDGRLGQVDFKDAGTVLVAIPSSEPFASIRFDSCSSNVVDPPDRAARARPIPFHILYCVFRD